MGAFEMADRTILIIDDNEQDQKIALRYLRKSGYGPCLTAGCGEDGLRLVQDQDPEVIVLDTMMPGIDGFETCRRLKHELRARARVIMMTGRVEAVDADRARAVGADDYCVKTADCEPLLAALRKVIEPLSPSVRPAAAADGLATQAAAVTDWGPEKTAAMIRRLSEELERKNEELQELDVLKSRFLSTVSHELRTPLTIIDAAISQILAGIYGPVSDKQREKLSMTLRNSQRLRGMIDELLDFAKLEAGQVTLQVEAVNFMEVAREVHNAFFDLAAQQGLTLELRGDRPRIDIQADRKRLLQVLTNLVGNAVKFTRAGTITVSAAAGPEGMECRVSDTGCGIAEKDLPRVFGRFQQFGDQSRSGVQGTGLGLSICKEIVELHGGTIRVESALGQGTTFIVSLPLSAAGGQKNNTQGGAQA